MQYDSTLWVGTTSNQTTCPTSTTFTCLGGRDDSQVAWCGTRNAIVVLNDVQNRFIHAIVGSFSAAAAVGAIWDLSWKYDPPSSSARRLLQLGERGIWVTGVHDYDAVLAAAPPLPSKPSPAAVDGRRVAALPDTFNGDRAEVGGHELGEGFTFTLHRDPVGVYAIGQGGPSLGYEGIANSVALRFDTRAGDLTQSSIDVSAGGVLQSAAGAVNISLTHPLWRRSGYEVHVAYCNERRQMNVSLAPVQNRAQRLNLSFEVDVSAALRCTPGVPCAATVGFTAATSAKSYASHRIMQFGWINAASTQSGTASRSGTPSGTPSSSSTPSQTPTSAPGEFTASADVSLTCPAGRSCSGGLNVCRSASRNVKAHYATFALGRGHGCAIDGQGDLRCWGNVTLGQAPKLVQGPFAHVVVLDDCTCALRRNYSLHCFGRFRSSCPRELPGRSIRHVALSPLGYTVFAETSGALGCVGNSSNRGCVNTAPSGALVVAVAGATSCALLVRPGGDGSVGHSIVCYSPTGTYTRTGTFGSVVAVGSGTFCALVGVLSTTPAPGSLTCWGESATALTGTAAGVVAGPFRSLGGSYHDPIAYAINFGGSLASWDAEHQTTRGCGGARCACPPGRAQCEARAASGASDRVTYAQPPITTGLDSTSGAYTCAVGCDMGVKCWGRDASNPLLAPPPWTRLPCAVAVPQDVGGDAAATDPLQCAIVASVQAMQRDMTDRRGACNLRGTWNNGTLFIDQSGPSLTLFPQVRSFGTISYAAFAASGEAGTLSSGGVLTIRDPATPFALPKAVGTVSADCSSIIMAGGSRWTATSRCAVRYLRISRGAAAAPSLVAGQNGLPSPSDGGQPALILGDLSVRGPGGVDLLRLPALQPLQLLSSSVNGELWCTGPLAGAACLGSAIDGNPSQIFSTGWAWGAGGARDPHGWLQLDFGREVSISSITLHAGRDTSGRPDPLLRAALLGVRVTGYDDRNSMAQGPPNATAAGSQPAFEYLVADGAALAADGGAYSFANVATLCGFDPRASASGTPSPTRSPSATPTASVTASSTLTASATGTPAGTPPATTSSSGTGSATPTPPATRSSSATPSATATATPTPTQSPSAMPDAVRNTSHIISAEQAIARAEVSISGVATAGYDWRADGSLASLVDAVDSDYQAATHTVEIAWEPFEDVGSGVASVAYCLGRAQFACDVHPWTPAPLVKASVDFAVIGGLTIAPGTVVFATVAAVNWVGLVSMTSSDGVYVDNRAPVVSRVVDTGKGFLHPETAPGAGTVVYTRPADIDCDEEGAGVGAAWKDAVALAGISHYEWAVGTAPNVSDIMPWVDVGPAFAAYNATVFVPAGLTYYASVRATGVNGLQAYGFSNGVTVLAPDMAHRRMLCLQRGADPLVVRAGASDGGAASTSLLDGAVASSATTAVSVSVVSSGNNGAFYAGVLTVACTPMGVLGGLVCT